MAEYLNQANKPKHVTARQLAGFYRAQKEGFSFNDNYNREHFKLDRPTYLWIREAVHSLTGISGEHPKLGEINQWLSSKPYVSDESGNMLTYLGSTVRVA
jgi:hypothetical protein